MTSISIPYIDGLSDAGRDDVEELLDVAGDGQDISCVNWPEQYPFCPKCSFIAAHDDSCIVIGWDVSGEAPFAVTTEDNGPVWEDSCCEFFIRKLSDNQYFNIEVNCIGSLLIGRGEGRANRQRVPQEILSRVERFTSLPKGEPIKGGGDPIYWSVRLRIPLDILGLSEEEFPLELEGNFYKCGDKTLRPHFLSWAAIDTPDPDFHRPEFFGKITLEA